MYTVTDLSKIKNKSRMNILNQLRRKGFLPKAHIIKRTDGFKEYAWADEYCKEIETALKITEAEAKNFISEIKEKPIDEKGMSIEERMKLHPLVKERRFFITSYFPDVRLADDDEEEGDKK